MGPTDPPSGVDHLRGRQRERARPVVPVPAARAAGTARVVGTAPGGNAARARAAERARVQRKLGVSRVDDPLEREADVVAARVVARAPVVATAPAAAAPPTGAGASAGRTAGRRPVGADGPARAVAREPTAADSGGSGPSTAGAAQDSAPEVTPELEALITGISGGDSLPDGVRERIEPHLGADLTDVRVHTGPAAAAAAAQLRARAFTYGKDVFLGEGESPSDLELMAHEATHVVQQGAVEVYRDGAATVLREEDEDDDWFEIPDWVLEGVSDAAAAIPGYTLLTQLIGHDPVTDRAVTTGRETLVEDLLTYLPGTFGAAVGPLLSTIDVLGDVVTIITDGLAAHDLTLARLAGDVGSAWEEFSVTNGIDGNVEILERYVSALVEDVKGFIGAITDAVIEAVRAVVAEVAEPLLETDEIEPVWSLTKKVLHHDPLRDEAVDAPTVEILADFLRLIDQEAVLAQMQERGTLQQTADWLDTQLGTFAGLVAELGQIFADAWAAIQPQNLPSLLDNLTALAGRVFGFLRGVGDFATTVIAAVLDLVKKALLGWLSEYAHEVPGFELLTVILERNPFTGDAVARTAENLIRGFILLLPGGDAMYAELAESGVIGDAAGRIESEMSRLGISWSMVTDLFLGIWDQVTLEGLLTPLDTFGRIIDLFGEPLGRLVEFIGVVVQTVLTLILALMRFPSELLGNIIANTVAAIDDIMNDPVGFLVNMLEAVKTGFLGFLDRIGGYLLQGLTDWLFRGLGSLGIQIPSDLSLESVLDLVLQVLGLSEETLWEKLAAQIGQERVDQIRSVIDQLTGAWAFIKDVQERGLVAIWEYVADQLGNLWDTILTTAKDWIVSEIIEKVATKLISMLDPTGVMAVVNSFIAFFNAIQSAIEYLREILEIVDTYVSTLAAVAAGDIAPGAEMLEGGLAAAIPVAIGFLANQVGLGNVPEKIVEIIQGLRELIDQALDWLFEQAMRLGQAALAALTGGGQAEEPDAAEPDDSGPWTPDRVRTAVAQDLAELPDELAPPDIRARLEVLLERHRDHGLHALNVLPHPTELGAFDIEVVASPGVRSKKFRVDKHMRISEVKLRAGTTLTAHLNGQLLGTASAGSFEEESQNLRGHAEQVLCLEISQRIAHLRADGTLRRGEQNELLIRITRSPCENCATRLARLAEQMAELGCPTQVRVEIASIYQSGQPTMAQSLWDLGRLRELGIELAAWDIMAHAEEVFGPDVDREKLQEKASDIQARVDEARTWLSGHEMSVT